MKFSQMSNEVLEIVDQHGNKVDPYSIYGREPSEGWRSVAMTLEEVIIILETAERRGAEIDRPEGTRYIQLSVTLLEQMIAALKNLKETELAVSETIQTDEGTVHINKSTVRFETTDGNCFHVGGGS